MKYFYLQERVQAKDPPSHYLAKLRTYLDPTASRSHRVRYFIFLLTLYFYIFFFLHYHTHTHTHISSRRMLPRLDY